MKRHFKAYVVSALALSLFAGDSASAGLKTIRGQFNRKEYQKAGESLMDEIPGMRGRTRDQAMLLLADLETGEEKASSLLEEVIRSGDDREALRARIELAKIRYATGEYHQAVRLLEGIRAEGRGGDNYEAVYFRGLAKNQLGDLEGARRDFGSIDRGDYLHWSYIALADIDMRSGRISEAVERYETIAAAHSSPVAGFRLGECYEMTGDRAKAVETFGNVARNFPASPEAPKAREKMMMIDSALQRSGAAPREEGGEEGEAPSGRYTLQFGAFSEKSNAHAFISDLSPMIDGLHIEVAESGGGLWYRVRAGKYTSREEAEEAALKIMERTGYSSKVLPIE